MSAADLERSALLQLLRELPGSIAPERIDRLWIFPPRALGERESGLLVLALRVGAAAPELRDLFTLRYEAERGRGGKVQLRTELTEQGRAPAERVPRVIDGVLRRLGAAEDEPRVEPIEGDAARWAALLAELGAGALDPASQE